MAVTKKKSISHPTEDFRVSKFWILKNSREEIKGRKIFGMEMKGRNNGVKKNGMKELKTYIWKDLMLKVNKKFEGGEGGDILAF